MKKLFALLSLIASGSLMAAPVNMACVTEHPTTSFVAFTEGENINVRLIHHNGVKYMPVWSNIITPNDLPVISETANILSELGNSMNFTIPASSCEVDGMMINCFGHSGVQEINGHKVNLWAVYTKIENERSFAGEFNSIWSNLAIDVDGKSYWIPMKYYDYECFKEWSAKGIKAKAATKNLFL